MTLTRPLRNKPPTKKQLTLRIMETTHSLKINSLLTHINSPSTLRQLELSRMIILLIELAKPFPVKQ
jgi:hypothetical protein